MKLIYVAGPYRAPTPNGVHVNIQRARRAAVKLWNEGWVVLCPHMNSANMEGLDDHEMFLQGDIVMLLRCDAIYMLKGFESSLGATEELRVATGTGLEVFYQ